MVSHAYDDSVAIMEQLIADGRDVTMLTNFASDTFREAQVRFPFLTKPRGVTVSGDIGLIKPDIAIYETHAKASASIPRQRSSSTIPRPTSKAPRRPAGMPSCLPAPTSCAPILSHAA
jgi:hypothetical protein